MLYYVNYGLRGAFLSFLWKKIDFLKKLTKKISWDNTEELKSNYNDRYNLKNTIKYDPKIIESIINIIFQKITIFLMILRQKLM